MNNKIQGIKFTDINALKKVVDSSDLFPSEQLDEMTNDYFNNEVTKDIWFAYYENSLPVSIGYCIPEKLTKGTYNLLAIGVSKDYQRKGIASEMIRYIEDLLKQKSVRVLIVETSSDDAQRGARNLYEKNGYTLEAIIRDFWKEGEDKIIFWKKL